MRGFTLIEVIVVLAIVGIAAAAVVPLVNNAIVQQELNNSALTLAADLRYLQQLAINDARGTNQYYLQLDPAANCYRLIRSARGQMVNLPASVRIKSGVDKITFYANGVPDKGHTITLASSALNKGKAIKIEGAIGRVRVEDVTYQP